MLVSRYVSLYIVLNDRNYDLQTMHKAVGTVQAADSELQQPLAEPPLEQLVRSVASEATPTPPQQVHSVKQHKRAPQADSVLEHLALVIPADSAPPTRPALSAKALPKQPVDLELVLPPPLDLLVQRPAADLAQILLLEDSAPRRAPVLLEVLRSQVLSVSLEALDRIPPLLQQEDLEHLLGPHLEPQPTPIQPVRSVVPTRPLLRPALGVVSDQIHSLAGLLVQIQPLKRINLRSADLVLTRLIRQPLQQREHSVDLARNLLGLEHLGVDLGVVLADLVVRLLRTRVGLDCLVVTTHRHLVLPVLAWAPSAVVTPTPRAVSAPLGAVCLTNLLLRGSA